MGLSGHVGKIWENFQLQWMSIILTLHIASCGYSISTKSHMPHGAGISTNMYHKKWPNFVGTYSSTVDLGIWTSMDIHGHPSWIVPRCPGLFSVLRRASLLFGVQFMLRRLRPLEMERAHLRDVWIIWGWFTLWLFNIAMV